MEQHNGPTSLDSPSPNPSLKSTQLPGKDRKDNWSWNGFSSPKIETSKAQFPLTGRFGSLLDGRAVEANRIRRDESGKGAAFFRSPAKPAICHPRCFLHNIMCRPEMRVWEPLWEFDATILSVTHRVSSESDGSAAAGELDTSKPNLTVTHNWWLTSMEKQMCNSRRCPQISRRNAHLMRSGADYRPNVYLTELKLRL